MPASKAAGIFLRYQFSLMTAIVLLKISTGSICTPSDVIQAGQSYETKLYLFPSGPAPGSTDMRILVITFLQLGHLVIL